MAKEKRGKINAIRLSSYLYKQGFYLILKDSHHDKTLEFYFIFFFAFLVCDWQRDIFCQRNV